MALATRSQGQPVANTVIIPRFLDTPTNTSLVLSNVSGELRVLDAEGLVLETNFVFLPRIKLADLSPVELRALLETENGHAALTTFRSLYGTNGQGTLLEKQLQQIWRQGKSLAEKIQTRLDILKGLREYNTTVALLPGSMAAAGQYEIHAVAVNDWLASGGPYLTWGHRAAIASDGRWGRHEEWERLERANDRAMAANSQAIGAEQQVAAYLAQCATLSARLASHGIAVPAAPPFSFIPPLTLKAEVDEERMFN